MARACDASRAVREGAVRCARGGALARRGSSNSASPTVAPLKGQKTPEDDQKHVATRQHLPQPPTERIETWGRVGEGRGRSPLEAWSGQLSRHAGAGWSEPLTWAVRRPLQTSLMQLLRPSKRSPVAQLVSLRSPSEAALQPTARMLLQLPAEAVTFRLPLAKVISLPKNSTDSTHHNHL